MLSQHRHKPFLGVERLEGRDLQSGLLGGGRLGAELIPPTESGATYHTTVSVELRGESADLRLHGEFSTYKL
jgi:hypothetical protein